MANVIKHKRGSGSDPGASDLVVGEVAIRTDTGKLFTKMDNGSVAEIAGGGSDIAINTLSSSSGTGGGSATFNGSAYRFTLSAPPSVSAYQLLVSINGVIQKPVAGTGQPSEGFSVDGNDIILGDAPATGSDFFILTFKSLGVSEPADNSVTSAKIADGAIVNADINASAAIARTKLANVDVVDDTSPQLGGNLASNGNHIVFADDDRAKFGTGNDLNLYHTSNENYIEVPNAGTGNLNIVTNGGKSINIKAGNNVTGSNNSVICNNAGSVDLYHNGSKKLETTTDGVQVSGNVDLSDNNKLMIGDSDDLQLYHDGTDSIIASSTGDLQITDTSDDITITAADDIRIRPQGGEHGINVLGDGAVELYHDNNKRLETTSLGVKVSGGVYIPDGEIAGFGDTSSPDLRIYHTGGSPGTNIIRGNTTAPLAFWTNSNERLRIDSSGRVGIGTTSPQLGAHIYHASDNGILLLESGDANCRLDLKDTGGQASIQSISDVLTFNTSSSVTERMRIDSSGNVGIGTTSPSGGKLHVVGSGNTGIKVQVGSSSADQIYLGNTGGASSVGTLTNVGFNLIQNGGVALAVNTSKNVGIGTTSPAANLHIHTDSNGEGVLIKSTGNTSNALTFDANRGTEGVIAAMYGRWNGTTVAQMSFISGSDSTNKDDGFITFGTESAASSGNVNATERMRIDSSGDVGIGTSSASARLHVSRSNNHQTACIINNSGTAGGHGLKVTSGGTGSGTKIFNVCRDNTASEEEVFTILGGGEVGIGTSSPSYALELVTASGDTQMRIRTLGTGSGDDTIFRMQVAGTTQDNFIYFGDSDDGNVGQIRYNHNSDFMSFRANSSERMRISSNGDIGAPNGDNIYDASDERLKENMLELTDGLNKINKLKPISYNYKVGWNKDTEGKTKYGFGAQTTEKVDKLLVESFSDNDATLNGETINNPLRVNEKFIIPLLVKAIQELTAKVEALEAK